VRTFGAGLGALTIGDALQRLAAGELSALDLTRACLDRIARQNDALGAMITVTADEALARAREADRLRAEGGWLGPLHGIPVSLKDLIDQRGVPTTAASRVRDGHVADEDAPLTARLREAGAVLIGKCNLHEFAFGTTNAESAYGPCRNPLDAGRSPGGSSGGSAASVIAGMCLGSIGTDTGGSVRIPAAACGLVGLRPGEGDVPTEGLVPLSPTLDRAGPLALTVGDVGRLMTALAGRPMLTEPSAPAAGDLSDLTAGVPRAFFFDRLDDEVRASVEAAIGRLASRGMRFHDVSLPGVEGAGSIYRRIGHHEAAMWHASTLRTRRVFYSPGVRERIEKGFLVQPHEYAEALEDRKRLQHGVDATLATADVLILPTLPILAPPIGLDSVWLSGTRVAIRDATLRLTTPFSLSGHPALSVPSEPASCGLPVGCQIVGRRQETSDLLRIAARLEAALRGAGSRGSIGGS